MHWHWRRIQAFLIVAIILAGLRTAWVLYERHSAAHPPEVNREESEAAGLDPDTLVFIRTSHIIDLPGLHRLIGKTVWVRNGWIYPNWQVSGGHVTSDNGTLPPLLPLHVREVLTGRTRYGRGVFLAFDTSAGERAIQIGSLDAAGAPDLQLDNMFFFDDPHQLYSHWSKDVWDLVDRHEVKTGMNMLQAQYSLGVGKLENGEGGNATMIFPRGGRALEVAFSGGKVAHTESVQLQ
jgi:hypothetical protein